jgi:hypothetical protein
MSRRDLTVHQWKILRAIVRGKNKPVPGKALKNLLWARNVKRGGLLVQMVETGLLEMSKAPLPGVELNHIEKDGGTVLAHGFTATPVGVAAAEFGDYEYEVVRDKSERVIGYKAVPDARPIAG